MNLRLTLGACVLLSLIPAHAQQSKPTIVAEGGRPDDRASARVLYWNTVKNGAAGQFAINYGRPVWKSDYEDPAKFDGMTTGKIWRMGSKFWTQDDIRKVTLSVTWGTLALTAPIEVTVSE
jgi:hypothetical protein